MFSKVLTVLTFHIFHQHWELWPPSGSLEHVHHCSALKLVTLDPR